MNSLLSKSHSTRFAAVGLALIAIASTACVKQNDAGVGIAKFDSSAVFGIAIDKPIVPGFSLPEALADTDFDLPDLPSPSPINPIPPTGPCPDAKLNAFPKATATPQVKGMPTEGLYTWKRNSFLLKNTANAAMPLQNLPFALQGRAIRRVTRESPHQFSYEMVAPNPFTDEGSVITTFRVNNNPELLVNRRVAARTIGVVPVPGYDARIANPGDQPGIFITRIEQQTASGTQVSVFQPVQPMMIAPLDEGILRSGQTFQSFGIDASSGTVITNNGSVGRTVRVDACGEIVEGYAVTLRQILTDDIQTESGLFNVVTTQESRSVDFIFASQFGVLPIGETLSLGDAAVDEFAIAARWELGALTPKALPDSLK
ncbi:MAG: hypothetical protein Q8K63_15170 [Acidimicrobiales bacterium]|nr:hypothetical protein [Acidimicrobiales bacterium]